MLSSQKHDLVLITWDDAGELALGWVQDSEIVPKELLAYSVGFLVKKTPKHVVLASTVGEPSANTNQFQIPRKMIKSIEIILKKGTQKDEFLTSTDRTETRKISST